VCMDGSYTVYSIRLITPRVPLERVIIDTYIFVFRKRHHGNPHEIVSSCVKNLVFLFYSMYIFVIFGVREVSQHLHKLFPMISLLPTIVSHYYRYTYLRFLCVCVWLLYFFNLSILFFYTTYVLYFAILHNIILLWYIAAQLIIIIFHVIFIFRRILYSIRISI